VFDGRRHEKRVEKKIRQWEDQEKGEDGKSRKKGGLQHKKTGGEGGNYGPRKGEKDTSAEKTKERSFLSDRKRKKKKM